jgi:hypothetical protein
MTFPAVDFPVYGLSASSWTGPRWLTFVQGSIGEPLYEVHLAHGSSRDLAETTKWVYLVTVPWPRFARLKHGQANSDRATLAWHAMFRLFDFTTPDHPRVRELQRKLMWLADERADEVESWPQVTLTVDGEHLACSISRWAGSWAAIVSDLNGAAIMLAASGVEPETLSLVKLTDGLEYHFKLSDPVDYPRTLVESTNAALGPDTDNGKRPTGPLHADHERLLRQHEA